MVQALEQIPLQPAVQTLVVQAVPLQTTDVNGGANIHLQPMQESTLEQSVLKDASHRRDTHWSSS